MCNNFFALGFLVLPIELREVIENVASQDNADKASAVVDDGDEVVLFHTVDQRQHRIGVR